MNYLRKSNSVIFPLIVINTVVFILEQLMPNLFSNFVLNTGMIFIQPWSIITSMFMHANFSHIFFNMYVLLMFGPLIEQRIGSKRFLGIYFLSGIVASLGFAFYHEIILNLSSSAVGASGAIMGIIGMVIILVPDLQVLFFFVLPMSMRTAGIIFALFDLFGVFYIPGIANTAHLFGMATGLIYGWYLLKKKKTFQRVFSIKEHYKKKQGNSYQDSITVDDDKINDYLKYGRI